MKEGIYYRYAVSKYCTMDIILLLCYNRKNYISCSVESGMISCTTSGSGVYGFVWFFNYCRLYLRSSTRGSLTWLYHANSSISCHTFIILYECSCLLDLINTLRKRYKMRSLLSILSLFCNELNKFNNKEERMLDSIYHMTCNFELACLFVKTVRCCHIDATLLQTSIHTSFMSYYHVEVFNMIYYYNYQSLLY